MELRGRVNGAARAQKKVVQYGHLFQQHTHSLIEYSAETMITKYGVLGLRVQCGKENKERAQYSPVRMGKI